MLSSSSLLMVFLSSSCHVIYIVGSYWRHQSYEWTHTALWSKLNKCEITQTRFIFYILKITVVHIKHLVLFNNLMHYFYVSFVYLKSSTYFCNVERKKEKEKKHCMRRCVPTFDWQCMFNDTIEALYSLRKQRQHITAEHRHIFVVIMSQSRSETVFKCLLLLFF